MQVHYFAAARAARGVAEEEITGPATLGELIDRLSHTQGSTAAGTSLAEVLQRCTFLVDGESITDSGYSLAGVARVDVLPPFAGG